jgi:hypothetical protein
VGRPSSRENLGELQNLPTIDLQKEISLVKSFRSTRGTKWWSGSEELVEGNHHWSGWSGEVAAMEEEHGWWRRKKKEIGLNHSHQPPI